MAVIGGLQHLSLLHHGDDELADALADDIAAAVDDGDAVLVCLPEPQWTVLADRIGHRRAGAVEYRSASDRYARPVTAMAMLSAFVDTALERGHPAVHAIGAISYTGTAADTPWLRYEAAVNQIFRSVPLRAVCVTDVATTPPAVLASLAHVHDDGDGGHQHPVEHQRTFLHGLPPANELPTRGADLELLGGSPREIRRALAVELAGRINDEELGDVNLVVSELVANAALHADGCQAIRLWLERDSVLLAVTDGADGPNDLAAGLRPAGLAHGGRGLWIVHQLCDPVDHVVGELGHTVFARLPIAG